jgi:opacity protein-like surface antigen
MKRILVLAVSALLLAPAAAAPVLAQGTSRTPAATTAPAATTTTAKPKRTISAGMAAMRERQKKCGAEWREAKAAGTAPKGTKWPQFWSACNKRLKAQGA